MNLINELSSLESELESLRAEVKILRENKILLDFENDQLRRRLTSVEERCEGHMAGKVRLKTILDRTGADLVAAIQSYNAETRDTIGIEQQPQKMIPDARAAE